MCVVNQELLILLKNANGLVAEIAARLERGDAARESIARLETEIKIIGRYVVRLDRALTEDCRAEIARLEAGVQKAVQIGDRWLANADGPELAAQTLQRRISQAYGLHSTRP